ncbi:family 43 glycosylhydrolase [Massilia horti]|nr:family 43 glycosylhydrolase [Massilia horti]
MPTRRDAIKSVGISSLLLGARSASAAESAAPKPVTWSPGIEGQRKADIGDGRFLNPILAGDHPDPTILKDGADYYMTFSSFNAYPGLVIWHSQDLVNWRPITAALTRNIGSVWAPDLCKQKGRYYLYIPTKKTVAPGSKTTSWVIWADDIRGPWSDPIDLNLPRHIDPGHAVGEDGSRWLFLSGGDRVRLSDDGLATVGEPQHVYDAWRYPEGWEVESFSPEGPKVVKHGEYFYLILAVGGTAGPPTGHMVIAARSRSINGPWENHPRNPLVRTTRAEEKWWSRGHASLVEGPGGDWWGVYHGYENGFWTLGRQTLLAPVTWTADGWLEFGGGDLSQPISKPRGGKAGVHGMALSDDFSTDKYGLQWQFFNPSPGELDRILRKDRVLHLKASGTTPSDSSPLLFVAPDQDYEITCEIEIDPQSRGGLLLFYDDRLYCGVGVNADRFTTYQYGKEHGGAPNLHGSRVFVRLRNRQHIVSIHTSTDGKAWSRYPRGMEVSGYHHNVRGGFLALKPGLFAAGKGEVRFRNFRYQAFG